MKAIESPTTRRAVLAGAASAIPAAALASMPALAAGPDPIFAAIERHRRHYLAYVAAVHAADYHSNKPSNQDELEEARDALCSQESVLAWELAETPTTLAGLAALVRYGLEVEERGDIWPDESWAGEGESSWWAAVAGRIIALDKLAVAS